MTNIEPDLENPFIGPTVCFQIEEDIAFVVFIKEIAKMTSSKPDIKNSRIVSPIYINS